MNGSKMIFQVILAIILVAVGWLYLGGFVVERTLLDHDFYRDVFDQIDFTPVAREMMLEELAEDLNIQIPAALEETMIDAIMSIYDGPWLEGELLRLIDKLILYVKGEQPAPPITIDLRAKNQEFRDKLKTFASEVSRQVVSIFGIILFDIEEVADEFIDDIPMPDHFDLNEYFARRGMTDDAAGAVGKLIPIRSLYRYLPYAAFLLFFVWFFLMSGLAGALKWFGAAFAASGFSFLLILRSSGLLFRATMGRELEGVPEEEIFYTFIREIISHATIIPVYYILIGVLLVIAGVLVAVITGRGGGRDEEYETY